MGNPAYKKCPRCELNYIKFDEDLCDVCKAELKLVPNKFADDEEEDDALLCPVCKKNYLSSYEEDMCASCREKLNAEEPDTSVDENDESWRAFLDDDKPVDLPDEESEKLLSELEEEEEDSAEDEEEESVPLPDLDDEYEIGDEEDFDDEDEDEDEEEEEDR